eukprot:1153357-Pelagomonas_calceolata.AAC.3
MQSQKQRGRVLMYSNSSWGNLATNNATVTVRLATCACSRTCLQLGQAQPGMAVDEEGKVEMGHLPARGGVHWWEALAHRH